MSIDKLTIANRLKAAEREGRTAEEIAPVLRDIDDERYRQLVTRDVLAAELEKLELRLKHDLTLRLGTMIVAAVAVLGGLNIFF